MALRVLLFVWIAAALAYGFLVAPLVPVLGATTRVLYLHVPAAMVSFIALGWSMLHSILYLARRRMTHDDQAAGAAELGILFCIVATISGSLWAKAQWGSYWNWDPRETSIFFVLLIYAAYLALRGALEEGERRARLSALYSVLAFVTAPFLFFVVPRLYASLHPSPILPSKEGGSIDPRILACALAMLVGFIAVFFWMLSLRARVAALSRRQAEADAGEPFAEAAPQAGVRAARR